MSINILVVDDNAIERRFVEGMLRENPDYHVQLAQHGKDALAKIQVQPPDLVLTDLVMPEMDGVALVRAMRHRYPSIPVILMTAYGDEATAVEAFEAGAASYVPKAQKAERLMEAIARVLEHAAADRDRQRLAQCVLEYHCRVTLDNDRQLISALVDQVQQTMAGMGLADTVERIRMGEALEEAILNAMYHGNLEISQEEMAQLRAELDDHLIQRLVEQRCGMPHIRDRKILVVVHLTADEARFVIRDEGRGFRQLAPTSRRASRFESGFHRGQTLISSLMDEVMYNEAGNELTMRKHLRKAAQ